MVDDMDIEKIFKEAEKKQLERMETINEIEFEGKSPFEDIMDALVILMQIKKSLEEFNKRWGLDG